MIYTVHSILQYFGLKDGPGVQPGSKAQEGAGSADDDQNLTTSSTCSTVFSRKLRFARRSAHEARNEISDIPCEHTLVNLVKGGDFFVARSHRFGLPWASLGISMVS